MAAIVPTVFSTELNAVPPQVVGYTPLPPQKQYGRNRSTFFTYVTTGTEVSGTIIGLCIVPKNALLHKSDIFTSASPGAGVTFSLGLAAKDGTGVIISGNALQVEAAPYTNLPYPTAQNDSGTLLGLFSPAGAAAAGTFADTPAHNVGFCLLEKDCILIATVGGATSVSASAILTGYIQYVVD